jgi:chemotaxis protein methyltransferase CheR
MIISQANLTYICETIEALSGIAITHEKSYLLETRLIPLAKAASCNSVDELISHIKQTKSKELITSMIELMTTNESSFFRDRNPFEILKNEVIPNLLLKNPHQKIKIWCAACSSGQEPYSIAMLIKENFPDKVHLFDILASDINDTIVKKAQKGIYTQFEIQRGLPIQLLLKYFTQVEKDWQLKNDILKLVRFKQANILAKLNSNEKFDIIFCRNVLIYFDSENKIAALSSLKAALEPEGVLFLGSSETIMNIKHDFKIYNTNYTGIYTQ